MDEVQVIDLSGAVVDQNQSSLLVLPSHLVDHCYGKLQADPVEPMDTTPATMPISEEKSGLTLLNQDQDTFETVLLQLLQTFTSSQPQSKVGSSSNESIGMPSDGAHPSSLNISAEALNTLSPEQVMALVTSNSVNYEVIQQIRTQKSKQKSAKSPDSLTDEGISQQLLQVTPEQLMQLNSQFTELLNQHKVNVPSDLSPDEQLKFIQSLLVQQLNTPQPVNSAPSPTTEEPPPKKVVKPSSSGNSKPLVKSRTSRPTAVKKRKEAGKKEPKKPPKPYNIFFGEVYSAVMAGNPKMSLTEASRIISDMWEAQGDQLKQRYHEAYEKLDAEYQQAMQEYHAEQSASEKPPVLQQLLSSDISLPPKGSTPLSPLTSPMSPSASFVRLHKSLTAEPATLVAKESGLLSPDLCNAEVTMTKMLNNIGGNIGGDTGICVNSGCCNKVVFSDERGPEFCSSECAVKHCRNVFDGWVMNRKVKAS